MKISFNWLAEHLPQRVTSEVANERLTMGGLEVEGIEPAGPPLAGVKVARIAAAGRHPGADSLQVCRVEIAPGEFEQVVCGAPNARAGLTALYAAPGARLPDGRTIGRLAIRGVESAGMLCSAAELGLGDDESGLLELAPDAPVGCDASDYLGLPDLAFEINLTPNRGDCLSQTGLARDLAALTGQKASALRIAPVPASSDRSVPIALEAPDACPRYVGRVISGVAAGAPTPLWMKERLRRCGVRSISAIVDVTNYVMLELGQPMHAFDLTQIDGGIRVRHGAPGERLVLLDGQTIEFAEPALVIADHAKAVALAGVMGGEHSGVSTTTTDILLESAYFAPIPLASAARRFKLHTDASHRFERGVDTEGQIAAMERATALVLELCGGSAGPCVVAESAAHVPAPRTIEFRPGRVAPFLGVEVAETEMLDIFDRLHFAVERSGATWRVTPPSYRGDVTREVDLFEEIARVFGYDRIPVTLPVSPSAMNARRAGQTNAERAQALLVARGYFEAITYSFISPQLFAKFDGDLVPKALANPIAEDMAVMRGSLWPGLLEAARHNLNRQQRDVRLFELGMVFRQQSEGTLEQVNRLGGVAAGSAFPEQWGIGSRPLDFFDIKQDVQALVASLGVREVRFQPRAHSSLHPGQSATLTVAGKVVGQVGALHPRLAKALELESEFWLFEIDFDGFSNEPVAAYEPISRFPSVRRDLSIVVDQSVPAAAILDAVRKSAGPLLKDLQLFDVYQGQGIDSGKKSVALGLIFQAASSTLTDDEIDRAVGTVLEQLERDVGGVLRN
ncbi:MAG: phenylalanine--tRNA ligase subunit beta [Gammaproteobacteria bacterium]|nr:phenylalanine--tRNA ligase subunit beta [Gammaproteobacteria bacterium]